MPDFSALLKKNVAEVKRPAVLPEGIYPGVVKRTDFGESSAKKTPYVRFTAGMTGWPDDIEDSDRRDDDGKIIDLSKKSMTRDFFLTDDALWRLSEFLQALLPGETGTMDQLVPEVVGKPVLLTIKQRSSQDPDANGRLYNECTDMKPAE